ncbi:MAG: hypothetical protein KC777_10020 [Cyanobacteria bacterium HKST-UBA02]|nr:hypothetical protein [Cyanobacteria bacterium HKST-UBA02]
MRNKIILFALGVLLPIAVLLIEAFTGVCKQSFFSPIPTPLHSALVATVPLGNLFLLLRTGNASYRPAPFDLLVAAIVLAISSVYSFLFLPLMPIAGMGMIMSIVSVFNPDMLVGLLGLCPLVPATSLAVAGILTRRILRARAQMKSASWFDALCSNGGLCTLYCFLLGIIWSVAPCNASYRLF